MIFYKDTHFYTAREITRMINEGNNEISKLWFYIFGKDDYSVPKVYLTLKNAYEKKMINCLVYKKSSNGREYKAFSIPDIQNFLNNYTDFFDQSHQVKYVQNK